MTIIIYVEIIQCTLDRDKNIISLRGQDYCCESYHREEWRKCSVMGSQCSTMVHLAHLLGCDTCSPLPLERSLGKWVEPLPECCLSRHSMMYRWHHWTSSSHYPGTPSHEETSDMNDLQNQSLQSNSHTCTKRPVCYVPHAFSSVKSPQLLTPSHTSDFLIWMPFEQRNIPSPAAEL